jgi:hypothetical protein
MVVLDHLGDIDRGFGWNHQLQSDHAFNLPVVAGLSDNEDKPPIGSYAIDVRERFTEEFG